jgi:hypothetical protein
MKKPISTIIFPALIVFIGLLILGFGATSEQNWQFMLGGAGVLLSGLVFLVNVLKGMNKGLQVIVLLVLIAFGFGLTLLSFKSIKDPIDFQNEKKRRYAHVVENLKDLRACQFAYKNVKGKYSNNLDTLLHFIKNDSFPVIKMTGTVPDTLTEEKAVALGLVSRDTFKISVLDSIFSAHQLAQRTFAFHLDSLAFIPFGGGKKFSIDAGTIDRNNLKVPVFEIIADKNTVLSGLDFVLISREKDLKVGSMTDPSTSGNWE